MLFIHTILSITGLVNALDNSDIVTVTDRGIAISMTDGMPKVYYLSQEAISSNNDDRNHGKVLVMQYFSRVNLLITNDPSGTLT